MPQVLAKLIDPNAVDPYPTFAVYEGVNFYGGNIYDSSFNNLAGYQISTSSEGNSVTYSATGSTVSSNSVGAQFPQFVCAHQAEGNVCLTPPAFGGNGPFWRHVSQTMSVWSWFGTVIGNVGIRQKISVYANGNTIRVYPRGGLTALESLSSTNTSTYRNIIGEPGTACQGQISYNSRTNTLVYLVSASGGNSYRAHVWRHPLIQLNRPDYLVGDLYRFMTEGRSGTNGASYYYNDFTWSTTSSTATEPANHMRVIMGDNEILGLVRFTPSTQTVHGYVTLNPSSTAPTGSVTTLNTNTVTTSYGIEQSTTYYGMRSNITWDNQWMACYAPYGWYGCGIALHIVNTTDPSKGYKYLAQDSTNGWQIAPIRENSFMMHRSINSDSGNLFNYYMVNPSGAFINGRNDNGTTIANGDAILASVESGYLDVWYSSTDYPVLVPMGSWVGGGR